MEYGGCARIPKLISNASVVVRTVNRQTDRGSLTGSCQCILGRPQWPRLRGLKNSSSLSDWWGVECPACEGRSVHDSEQRVNALSPLLLIAWRRTTVASSRKMSYVFSPPVLAFEKLAVPEGHSRVQIQTYWDCAPPPRQPRKGGPLSS